MIKLKMTLREAIEEVKRQGVFTDKDTEGASYYATAIATILNAVVKGELK